MLSIDQILTFTTQNEHVLEHDVKQKPLFSNPKIYTAKGDLSKRWYVYFSFRNPATGKLQRMKNIYGKTNLYKTKEERLLFLTSYRKNLLLLLKEGFNPFEDNTKLLEKRNQLLQQENNKDSATETTEATNVKKVVDTSELSNPSMEIKQAFEFALRLKEKQVSERTIKDYKNKSDNFIKWLQQKHPDIKYIGEITRKVLLDFLNDILLKTSPRSRNNYRVDLSSLFQVLKDNELVDENFIKSIPVLKLFTSKRTIHITYNT